MSSRNDDAADRPHRQLCGGSSRKAAVQQTAVMIIEIIDAFLLFKYQY